MANNIMFHIVFQIYYIPFLLELQGKHPCKWKSKEGKLEYVSREGLSVGANGIDMGITCYQISYVLHTALYLWLPEK